MFTRPFSHHINDENSIPINCLKRALRTYKISFDLYHHRRQKSNEFNAYESLSDENTQPTEMPLPTERQQNRHRDLLPNSEVRRQKSLSQQALPSTTHPPFKVLPQWRGDGLKCLHSILTL